MVREAAAKYKGERLQDHHLTRKGDSSVPKGGAGKGNWGDDKGMLSDLGIRVGSPFEDPKLSPNLNEVEPKLRLGDSLD
jgi:hypothetical protein